MKKIRIGSHFSGIGSINEAILKYNLPFEVTYSIEWDKKTQEAYKQIYNTPYTYGDISKINPKELPEVDIIMTSPPCQAYSNAGLKKGMEDDRGKILLETFKIIEFQKPKIVIFENVPNIKTINNGKVFDFICKTFEIMDFKIYTKNLNSINYGVPQNRERVFIIAIDKNISKRFYFPRKQQSNITLKDLLCKEAIGVRKPPKIEEFKKLFPIKKGRLTQSHERENYNHEMSKRVYKPYISPTLVCSNDIFFYIDKNFRTLTSKERFKLHGFTKETINKLLSLNLGSTRYIKITGNTITVNVLGALLKQILKLNINYTEEARKTGTEEIIYNYGLEYIEKHLIKTKRSYNIPKHLPLKEKQILSAKKTHQRTKEVNTQIIEKTIETLKATNTKVTQYKIIKYSGISKNTVKKYLKTIS